MRSMKTPGVYIVEKQNFQNSITEEPTAIPAFVGYTEFASTGKESLTGKPHRISSMAEYTKYFGGANTHRFTLAFDTNTKKNDTDFFIDVNEKNTLAFKVQKPDNLYTLYYHLTMFFANGGEPCYIVSVGNYQDIPDAETLCNGITCLDKEPEHTLLVIPEAANLKDEGCMKVQTAMLKHCGENAKKRFAIFDIPQSDNNGIQYFRNNIGSEYLSFGAAYYPYLETSVLRDSDITENILVWKTPEDCKLISDFIPELIKISSQQLETLLTNKKYLHQALLQNWPAYKTLVNTVKDYLNLLPPSSAMAGIYTKMDNTRGVWKAPANVSVNYAIKPSVNIDNRMQEDLNVPMNGKSINAIRYFKGEGIKVWGARTLDGNSLDWRYINVRRTMIFLEETIKNATRAFAFEPNDANTWITLKNSIENFLRSVWKRGGLAGASPEDAYEVHIGLGDTMTPEDILEGIMRISVLTAISHPAEFMEISFEQQMQKNK